MKKKDDGKKPKASASKSTVKTPASKPKPLSNAGKYGLGAVARTVKGQGEMKQMMARPKTGTAAAPKVKPNRDQRARAAGMVAAQRSRREGAKINSVDKFFERESQKFMNDIDEMPSYKGTKIDKENRYSGLSNNQIEGKTKTPSKGIPLSAKPKVKPKPTRSQKARAAGMLAAEKSRKEGSEMMGYEKAAERNSQRMSNYWGGKKSKTGGVIDSDNRYSGLSNKQLK